MQSVSLAIRPAEHQAGDFIRMHNAHQQKWCVGSSSGNGFNAMIIMPSLGHPLHCLEFLVYHWITKHCLSSWLHYSSGCCVSVFSKSQFRCIVCARLILWASYPTWRLCWKNWAVTNGTEDDSHLFCISSPWIGILNQTFLSKHSCLLAHFGKEWICL